MYTYIYFHMFHPFDGSGNILMEVDVEDMQFTINPFL